MAVISFEASSGSGNPSSEATSISIVVTLIKLRSNLITPGKYSLIKDEM